MPPPPWFRRLLEHELALDLDPTVSRFLQPTVSKFLHEVNLIPMMQELQRIDFAGECITMEFNRRNISRSYSRYDSFF